MGTVTAADGITEIHYKDWGRGQPVLFSHGWPLSADVWDQQLNLVAENGYRAIAHDRRGHGRSGQPWGGHDMDTYADDLAELMNALDLRDTILVGHSTGGGEVARYIGRHGTSRVARAVLVGAVPPLMLRTETNPAGTAVEVFDDIRTGVREDRSQFFQDLTETFYGVNRPRADVSEGMRDAFWLMSMQAGLKPALDCIKAFSETDFTADLERFDIPTLVAHGDADQIVPIEAAALQTVKHVKDAVLKVYPDAPHGLTGWYQEAFNTDLMAFIRS